MSLAARAMSLILAVSCCAGAQTRRLAVYSGPASGLDAEAKLALQLEVQRLLAPAGIEILWKDLANRRAGEDFDLVVVSSFHGSCSVAELPSVKPDGLGPETSLAETSISNGRILPFLHVDCGRLIQVLTPQLEPVYLRSRQAMLGRALGRVIGHEMYHIIAQTAEHHDTGVTKAALSAHDLTTSRFDFDPWSMARLRPPSMVGSSVTEGGDAGR